MFDKEKLKERVKDLEVKVRNLEEPNAPRLLFNHYKQEVLEEVDNRLLVFEAELKKVFVEQISQVYKELKGKGSKVDEEIIYKKLEKKLMKVMKDKLHQFSEKLIAQLTGPQKKSKKPNRRADKKRGQYLS